MGDEMVMTLRVESSSVAYETPQSNALAVKVVLFVDDVLSE